METHIELTLSHGVKTLFPVEGMVVLDKGGEGCGIYYPAKHGGWEVKESYAKITKWLRVVNRRGK